MGRVVTCILATSFAITRPNTAHSAGRSSRWLSAIRCRWLVPKGLHDASSERAQLEALALRYPDANIAIRCGEVSNVVVIDCDPRNGSDETVAKLAREGKTFPDTVEAASPRGGDHKYFALMSACGSARLTRSALASISRPMAAISFCLRPGGQSRTLAIGGLCHRGAIACRHCLDG